MFTHKELKARALARADVKAGYDQLGEEFAFLDEFLKARGSAGITQAQVAERIGTTQSAIARLESGNGKHSPSVATLRKYAHALGCRLEVRLAKGSSMKAAEGTDLRSEYRREDLATGIRGKHLDDFRKGTRLVLLSPDVATAFPDGESVNTALRSLLDVARRTAAPTGRSSARAKGRG